LDNLPDPFIIAVDGLAASGKGTIAKKLANELQLKYLDTGKLYRFLALKSLELGIEANNLAKILNLADEISIPNLESQNNMDNEDVAEMASRISAIKEVRLRLLKIQQDFAAQGAVLDGRDIGSVVVPYANYKLFITANLQIRATRRFKQMQKLGHSSDTSTTLEEVKQSLLKRDQRDLNREVAPLIIVPDAMHIDTSNLDIEQAFSMVLENIKSNLTYIS
jgi:cytidylate kinase